MQRLALARVAVKSQASSASAAPLAAALVRRSHANQVQTEVKSKFVPRTGIEINFATERDVFFAQIASIPTQAEAEQLAVLPPSLPLCATSFLLVL